MSLAYKVEELLALRDSVSESAVSIEKFADEDVIKEHVLRPSASASANFASRASSRSLRPPTVTIHNSTAPDKKPSPSPSFKRGKAEKLLKEHGSPPGLRVTAGGRIVPSDLAPLSSSRNTDTIRPQPLRVSMGINMPAQSQATNGTARVEVIGGQPVVFVGDRMFAIPVVNATNSTIPPEAPFWTEPTAKQGPNLSDSNTNGALFGVSHPSRTGSVSPFDGMSLSTLKAQQIMKKQELRSVEQTEVLQSNHQSEAWRTCMIEKKRGLIVELDALRKQIAAVDVDAKSSVPTSFIPESNLQGPVTSAPYMNTFEPPFPQAVCGYPAVNPYATLMMYQPQSYGPLPSFSSAESVPVINPITIAPHSPGSASRRSHAIEIKPPPSHDIKKQTASALDPKSPTYEPTQQLEMTKINHPPTPSPSKRSPWQDQEGLQSSLRERRGPWHRPSLSSIDTTDFFPTNAHEHSSTRLAPQVNENGLNTGETSGLPSTPEKHWPASPWNEGHSGHSRQKEPVSKLTSWPEAFGNPPSLASLRRSGTDQPSSSMLEGLPLAPMNMMNPNTKDNSPSRTRSEQRTTAEENWPFSRRAAVHVLSTYQEGYQAGYDHVGIPDSPEVLQGYIQGLLHFLADESKKRQAELSTRIPYTLSTGTLLPRGPAAELLPRDSAINMTFERNGLVAADQENLRSTGAVSLGDSRRVSGYGPQDSITIGLAQPRSRKDTRQDARQQVVLTAKQAPPGMSLEGAIKGFRQVEFSQAENGVFKGTIPYKESYLAGHIHTKYVLEEQLPNRGYSTSVDTKGMYATSGEVKAYGSHGDGRDTARSSANYRVPGLDGAMDDMSEMANDVGVQDESLTKDGQCVDRPAAPRLEEVTASCFGSTGGKGKQKMAGSPSKSSAAGKDNTTWSAGPTSGSPRRSGDQSPAKAKLEHVTNKFRRGKKEDGRAMSPEERVKRSEKWRARFQHLKRIETEEIEEYRKNNRV
ncbi:meiotic recombination [Coniothyrium glycines]